MPILNEFGKPFSLKANPAEEVRRLRGQIAGMMRAKYDAAQTSVNNERHWANADYLDPHASNAHIIRRKLRSRSRYEIIENNPYLKGVLLSLANDFVRSGPKLKITDKEINKSARKDIETKFNIWCREIKFAHKLWQMKIAKVVDGESFLSAFTSNKLENPCKLNFKVIETDRIASPDNPEIVTRSSSKEIDGVRFDNNDEVTHYHLLNYHPGSQVLFDAATAKRLGGKWVDARYMVHWFRQDRPWFRGIPELTPSLPLCALLRRYTLAVVRAAEVGANFSAVLEQDGPGSMQQWTDENGNLLEDDPFDVFPIEMGMFSVLPWGAKMKQFESKQPMQVYDMFVNSLLREIIRPLLVPFNVGAGTSKDSNMSSSVVDSDMYKSGQQFERFNCGDFVLNQVFSLWWQDAKLIEGYLPTRIPTTPQHYFRWDKIGVDHTDPTKVANSLQTMFDGGHITDRDIQEQYFSRDVEDWREEVEECIKWRQSLNLAGMGQLADPNASTMERKQTQGGTSSPSPKKAKTKSKK